MLADQGELKVSSGTLDHKVHRPGSWRFSLLSFVSRELPKWRDDPYRPMEKGETILTSQLCAHMNSAARMSRGWDILQFRIEEPDESVRSRRVDLVPAPSGTVIWIDGKEYTQYAALLPIECKRLPTPSGPKRDEREYLFSALGSTGGVQRFKAGLHGAAHSVGAMVGYIQKRDIEFWMEKIGKWLTDLVENGACCWEEADALCMVSRDIETRTAVLTSAHRRSTDLPEIQLFHLWVDMRIEIVATE